MALAPRLRALGSCVARTAFNTSAAPAEFAAPAVLRALDSYARESHMKSNVIHMSNVARTASNTSAAPEVFWSAAPAVFRGASLTGKSITQLKTHTETRCDTGFKPPGIRPRHTPLTALWILVWQGGIRKPHGVQGGGILRRFLNIFRFQAGRWSSQSARDAVGHAWFERKTPAKSPPQSMTRPPPMHLRPLYRVTPNLQPRIGCTRMCLYRVQHVS